MIDDSGQLMMSPISGTMRSAGTEVKSDWYVRFRWTSLTKGMLSTSGSSLWLEIRSYKNGKISVCYAFSVWRLDPA
jgi:hypothetical protein